MAVLLSKNTPKTMKAYKLLIVVMMMMIMLVMLLMMVLLRNVMMMIMMTVHLNLRTMIQYLYTKQYTYLVYLCLELSDVGRTGASTSGTGSQAGVK